MHTAAQYSVVSCLLDALYSVFWDRLYQHSFFAFHALIRSYTRLLVQAIESDVMQVVQKLDWDGLRNVEADEVVE